MRDSLVFYCQHSLGIGHLPRSLALADAFGAQLDPTFTPPWNLCSADTLAQLAGLAGAQLNGLIALRRRPTFDPTSSAAGSH